MHQDDRFHNKYLHYSLLGSIYFIGFLTLTYHTIGHAFPVTASLFSPTCNKPGVSQEVQISKDSLTPRTLNVHRCDVVRFRNTDTSQHVMAFGSAKTHVDYPDFSNKLLQPGDTQSVTLRKSGSYQLHDYLSDTVSGQLTIQ